MSQVKLICYPNREVSPKKNLVIDEGRFVWEIFSFNWLFYFLFRKNRCVKKHVWDFSAPNGGPQAQPAWQPRLNHEAPEREREREGEACLTEITYFYAWTETELLNLQGMESWWFDAWV